MGVLLVVVHVTPLSGKYATRGHVTKAKERFPKQNPHFPRVVPDLDRGSSVGNGAPSKRAQGFPCLGGFLIVLGGYHERASVRERQ